MNLKNKVDYIYEFSDLNLFHIRSKVLTGDYANTIIEFGGSHLMQKTGQKGGDFTFNYILYQKPEKYQNVKLIGDSNFEKFLSELLINIINDKRNDKDDKKKLDEAANEGNICEILIDEKFYREKFNQKETPTII
jgi:hypothetical protein